MKKFYFVLLCAISGFILLAPLNTDAQRRDYMTDAESELVREAQQIDLRIEVLVKMIDRRFAVLNGTPLKPEKKPELWGEPPTGTRIELLSDISKLLQKAVDDIDDVAAHNRMDEKFFPKAMRHLSAAAAQYQPQIKAVYDRTPDEKEKGLLMSASEFCAQIIEASAKVPKEAPKESKESKENKKKKSKNDTE